MNKNINNITRNSFYFSLKSLIQTSFLIIIIIILQIKVKAFKIHHKSLETNSRILLLQAKARREIELEVLSFIFLIYSKSVYFIKLNIITY